MESKALSRRFILSFLNQLSNPCLKVNIESAYSESSNWTELLLGCTTLGKQRKEALLKPVLEDLKPEYREIEGINYGVYFEYYHIDVMLYVEKQLKMINSRQKYYYWKPIVCVEHENSYDTWYSELVKLSNISTNLNVVISYCSNKDLMRTIARASDLMNYQLASISKKPFDEFLLILGYRNIDFTNRKPNIKEIVNGFRFYELVHNGNSYFFQRIEQ